MSPGFGAGLVIETHSLPALARCYPCSFTFYVADPSAPLKLVRFPRSLAPTLVALPSMSLIPQLHSRSVARSLRVTIDHLTALRQLCHSNAVSKSKIASALGALMFSQ
jgi:hypothetical protein